MCLLMKLLAAISIVSVVWPRCEAQRISTAGSATGHQLYAGNACSTQAGSYGTCKKVDECPKAREIIAKGETPDICSFSGSDVLVCCSNTEVNGVRPLSEEAKKTKSYQKCELYGRTLVTKLVRAPTLSLRKTFANKTMCRMQRYNDLVINGLKSKADEFPHMALLGFGSKDEISWECGGTLISERFVLTAGHCIFRRGLNVSFALLGDLNITDTTDNKLVQQIAISNIIPHPEHQPPSLYNDIALLKLRVPAIFTRAVRPACIHTIDTPGYETLVPIVTGWGITETGKPSDHLMKADLRFIGMRECSPHYKLLTGTKALRKGMNESTMLCAGDPNKMRDSCQGDSGGPLQLILTKPYCMYGVVGITSFGPSNCGTGNSPGVYTRVSAFRPWIESIVWPD